MGKLNNIDKAAAGKGLSLIHIFTVPTQDMVLGSYYLTLEKPGEPGEGKVFRDVDEATMAYDDGTIGLHARIKIRMTKEIDGKPVRKLVSTTMGRVIFNGPIPQDLGFVDRSDPENDFKLEVDFLVNKKKLGEIIDRCIKIHGTSIAADMLDKIKAQDVYKRQPGAFISLRCSSAQRRPSS